jgi:oxalate decarboxylase/phosphoglucose isomerase-like protein (cupin superfamily)
MSEESTVELTLVRQQEAEVFMEGGELVRLYAHTDKITFSVATIPPGQKGMLDPGHEGAHEVAYVIKGHLMFEFPDSKKWLELRTGDAVIIPEGEAHSVINVGEETATVSWSLAPHMGRPWLTK